MECCNHQAEVGRCCGRARPPEAAEARRGSAAEACGLAGKGVWGSGEGGRGGGCFRRGGRRVTVTLPSVSTRFKSCIVWEVVCLYAPGL